MRTIKKLLPYLIFAILLATVYFHKKSQIINEIIDKQNTIAERDSLIKGEDEIFHKYVYINHINDSLSNVLRKKNEEIFQKTELIVKLNKMVSEGYGGIDTLVVPEPTCQRDLDNYIPMGTNLYFSGNNSLRRYNLNVFMDDPPYHKLEEKFNPFDVDIYLTRNKGGIYSAYGIVSPSLSNFIKFRKMNVHMEKDEFNPKSMIKSFGVTALLQINFYRSTILGGGTIKFDTWNFGYLRNFYKEHSILVGYTF